MRYFYSKNLDNKTQFAELANTDKQHLFKTLRGKIGDEIGILNGNGIIAKAKIIDKNCFEIISFKEYSKPKSEIHIFLSMPKKQKIDFLLKQTTEIGVTSINPIVTTNTEFKYLAKYKEKWEFSLIEGCKQSKNPFIPIINEPIPFEEAINKVENIQSFYGAVTQNNNFKDIEFESNLAWFVGPEGGFSEKEIKLMEVSKFIPFNISPHIMRIETAVITGANLLQNIRNSRSLLAK